MNSSMQTTYGNAVASWCISLSDSDCFCGCRM